MSDARCKQYVLIVPDGAADRFVWRGRSPLALARTPHLDLLAQQGVCGLMQTLYPDLPKDSAVAHLGMLGWDPHRYYPAGRASCELAALGVELGAADLAFRANFVTFEGRTLASYSAGQIATAQARPLVERLRAALAPAFPDFELFHHGDFRNSLLVRGAGVDPRQLVCAEPHESQGRDFDCACLVAGRDERSQAVAARINRFLAAAARLLAGEAANMLFPWSASRRLCLPPFAEGSGLSGRAVVVGYMDFLQGIAQAGGLEFVKLGNGRPDTDYAGKGAAVERLLAERCELVICHVNAPDEAAHMGDLELKLHALEQIDFHIVRPVREHFLCRPERLGGVLVVPDHYTNSAPESGRGRRAAAHAADPVPFALWNGRDRDAARYFSEADAARAWAGRPAVSHLDLLRLLGVGREPWRRSAPEARQERDERS
ncbi:MAG TPA: hypothetical protein VHQ90_17110 [Thermoanaerobaculia bacterium]|nr:hypothetical protein [Thermoanaerobaculia bacterium]